MNLYVDAMGVVCALGTDAASVRQHLFASTARPLTRSDAFSPGREVPLGMVGEPLPALDGEPPHQRSRNNALARAALAQIRPASRLRSRATAPTRRHRDRHQHLRHRRDRVRAAPGAGDGGLPADFHYGSRRWVARPPCWPFALGPRGAGLSSFQRLHFERQGDGQRGARLIRAGLCDAVLTGGADALCGFTVAGFTALESVSRSSAAIP